MRRDDAGWTGSMKHPWVNPPMQYKLGAARGLWWETMAALGTLAVAAYVILVLVSLKVLDVNWGYAMLPVIGLLAVIMGLVTVFKAVGEEKGQSKRGRDQ